MRKLVLASLFCIISTTQGLSLGYGKDGLKNAIFHQKMANEIAGIEGTILRSDISNSVRNHRATDIYKSVISYLRQSTAKASEAFDAHKKGNVLKAGRDDFETCRILTIARGSMMRANSAAFASNSSPFLRYEDFLIEKLDGVVDLHADFCGF